MHIQDQELSYLRLLSAQYPSVQATSTAIMSLTAELNLLKGTEHFISDIHGEYDRFCHVLKNASRALAHLHIIGDIYDRGPGAEKIMDALMNYHSVDIQWGNHDILWMGAAAGSEACMASVIRISLRYSNLETLENGYGVSLMPLASFAVATYDGDPCERFAAKPVDGQGAGEQELRLMAQMHKAITIIQLKLEGQVIERRPQYQMGDRLLLNNIDYDRGSIQLDDTVYPLGDTYFPTIDPDNPYQLTAEESSVVDKLKHSFENSSKLQKHVRFLFSNGGMYRVHDGNLLYHGCIAMNGDSSFKAFKVCGEEFSGKAFMDRVDRLARQGFFSTDDREQKYYGMDAMWYLWCGAESPLFGKEKMATFERYFVAEKKTHVEPRNAYYDLRHDEAAVRKILEEFGVDPDTGRVINGHVPVRVTRGESPIKANGKLVVIDGGFSRAYQNQTGIAGYTLVSDSGGLQLIAHEPYESAGKYVENAHQGSAVIECLETHTPPLRMRDTDEGREIQKRIEDLQRLLEAYRGGLIRENP